MSLALAWSLMSLEARKLLSYRADFWVTMVSQLGINLLVLWALWTAMFAESGAKLIGGWDLPGILAYGVMVFLTGKIVRGGDLQMSIANDIYQGALSRYLLYPQHYVAIKYAQQMGNILPDFVQSIAMAVIGIPLLGLSSTLDIDYLSCLMALPALWSAHLLFFLLGLFPQFIAFWADNVWSLSVFLRLSTMLLGGAMLPLSLFPEGPREILRVFPFAYLFEFPTLVLLGKVDVWSWLEGLGVSLVWCLILALCAVPLWHRGRVQYTGVGI
jgi:ABC-2 type transport system permease protein